MVANLLKGTGVLCKGLDTLLNWTLAALMIVMLVVVAAQVWYRFVLNDPLTWSEEMARYLFVWISFLGSAVGVRLNIHLGIDLIEKFTGPTGRKILFVTVNLLIQIFLVVAIFWGIKVLGVVRYQTSASMGISMVYPYLAIPVGGGLMFLNSLRNTVKIMFGHELSEEMV